MTDIIDTVGIALVALPTIDEAYAIDNTTPSVAVSALLTSDSTPAIVGTVDDPTAAVAVLIALAVPTLDEMAATPCTRSC